MAVTLSPVGGVAGQFFDNNGDPLVGGKLFTYAAGTTTPQATFTSATGTTPNSNPIILNGGGRVPAEIWLTDGLEYKFVLYSSTDQLIGSWDNIVGINSNFVNYTAEQEIQTATADQTVFTLTTMQYLPGTNSLSVFVDGVNQYGPGAQYAYVETNSTTVTFVTGLHVGASVKFTTATINSAAATSADLVSYTPAGTGAVVTNVQAKLRETVSVKDFGAVGDGVTDDTAAIQAAVSSGATSVYFPAGVYICEIEISIGTCPLGIPNLIGESTQNTYLIKPTPTSTNPIIYMGQTNIQWRVWEIKNLSIGGYPSNDPADNFGVGILFGHVPYESGDQYAGACKISNCDFSNLSTAIWKPYGNIGNTIEYCSFNNCNYHYRVDYINPYTGEIMQPGNDTIYKCHFAYAELASFYMQVDFWGAVVAVRDCIFETMPGYAFYVENTGPDDQPYLQGLTIENVYCENCGSDFGGVYAYFEKIRRVFVYNSALINIELKESNIYLKDCGPSEISYLDSLSYAHQTNVNIGTDAVGDSYVSEFYPAVRFTAKGVLTKPRAINGTWEQSGGTPSITHPFDGQPPATAGFSIQRDGLIFPVSWQIETLAGATQLITYDSAVIDKSKWYVVTVDIKQGNATKADEIIIQSTDTFFMRKLDEIANQRIGTWVTIANIRPPYGSGSDDLFFRIINTSNASPCYYNVSAFQAIAFNSYDEAMRFLDSGIYAYKQQTPVTFFQDSAPTTGSWVIGDTCLNSNATVGQPKGWVYDSTGTWRSLGNL